MVAPPKKANAVPTSGKDIFDHGVLQQRLQQQIVGYEYEGNEEMMTDEARTNEEEEEFIQKQQQLLMSGAHYNQQHMFFNDDEEEEEAEYDGENRGDSSPEEGQFIPSSDSQK